MSARFVWKSWSRETRVLVGVVAIAAAECIGADPATPLSMPEAERLALTTQPLLDAKEAAVRAARAQAVADRQLPDPTFIAGMQDLPIAGDPAFTLDRDEFTMLKAGIRQEFPRAEKRRLKGQRGEIEAREREFELETAAREVRRDAGIAWLDVYQRERFHFTAKKLVDEYAYQVRALEVSVGTNAARQADLLAARSDMGRARDYERALRGDVERARAELGRLVGEGSARPLTDALPSLPEPQPLEELLSALRAHPHLNRYAERVRLAEADVAIARQDYKPDLAVSVEYGYRREFPDFVGVEVEFGLPLFRGNRQDERLRARDATAEETQALQRDVLRQHEADARRAYADWQSARDRRDQLVQVTLPAARDRVQASRLAFESANGAFVDVLGARRELLEIELSEWEQRVAVVRAQVQLRFFAP